MNPSTYNLKWLGRALLIVLLLPTAGFSQDVMTHEELMRRARGLPPVAVATNASPRTPVPPARPPSAPVVVAVAPPAALPAAPAPESHTTKPKATVFSEVPPEFYDLPATPPPPALAAANATNAMATLDDKHLLAIGDRLSFRIVEDEEEPKALLIMDSGELEVPYLGRFAAAGKTCQELARALKAELEKEYYYRATVIIAVDLMARSRGKVYLVGPVRAPGPQEIPSDEILTLSKAILRAGGFTDFADKKTVKVTRKSAEAGREDQTFTVNVGDILEKGRTDTDLPLYAGDLVYIQERMIRF